MKLRKRAIASILLYLGLGAVLPKAVFSLAPPSRSTVGNLLSQKLKFSDAELRAFDAGSAVIKSLDTPIREELAYVGAVYLEAPSGRFVERFRDIVGFETGPAIPQIGRFNSPPRPEDLASLTLPRKELFTLRDCRPSDCDMKLSAAAMRRFRDEVDWSSPHADRQANEIIRQIILDLVRAYQENGNAALGHYDDGDEPLPVAEQVRELLGSSNPLPVPVPKLLSRLNDYPHGRLAGAENFIYWTVSDFGLKPTIRVNHVTIYPRRGSSPPSDVSYVIAIKQLYASHYFHTTLELRFLIDDPPEAGRGATLISIIRSRNDGMTGFKGFFLRPIIRARSRDAVRTYLNHVKRQVERPASPAS